MYEFDEKRLRQFVQYSEVVYDYRRFTSAHYLTPLKQYLRNYRSVAGERIGYECT